MNRWIATMTASAVAIASPVAVSATAHASSQLSCSNPTTVQGTSGGVAYPGGYRVNSDDWTGAGSTVVRACSEHEWIATVTQRGAPATGVKTYPDSERTWTDWSTCASQPRVDSFKTLTSTYAMTLPNAGSWDAGYDVFLDGGPCHKPTTEIMVLNRWRNVDWPASTSVTLGGVDYWVAQGTNFVQLRRKVQVSSGSQNLRVVLRRYAPKDATVQFVQYGVEVLTTRGKPETFKLTDFSVS